MQHRSAGSIGCHDRPGRAAGPRRVIAGLLLLAIAMTALQAAAAQSTDRPLMLPTREVAVIYEVDQPRLMDGAQKVQVTYADAGDRTRLDYFRWREAKYLFAALIFDRRADRVLAILPERRSYIERKVGKIDNPGMFLKPTMRFTRQGTATVAGLICTEWKIRPPDKDEDAGSACVTDDGLALRLAGGGNGQAAMTAAKVVYGLAPEGVFNPPADFDRKVAQ